jgi:hypothetical protein
MQVVYLVSWLCLTGIPCGEVHTRAPAGVTMEICNTIMLPHMANSPAKLNWCQVEEAGPRRYIFSIDHTSAVVEE